MGCDIREGVNHGPEVFGVGEVEDDPAWCKVHPWGEISEGFAVLEFGRAPDLIPVSDMFGPGDGETAGHLLALAEEGGVSRTGANGVQLLEERGAGQGEGVVEGNGAKLVKQPDAVPFAATEEGADFVPTEGVGGGVPGEVDDGVETFKPIWMAGHEGL